VDSKEEPTRIALGRDFYRLDALSVTRQTVSNFWMYSVSRKKRWAP